MNKSFLPYLFLTSSLLLVWPLESQAAPQRICLENDGETLRIRKRCNPGRGRTELGIAGIGSNVAAIGPKGDKGDPGTPGEKGEKGDPGSDASLDSVAAGGALAGNYPNPNLADGIIVPESFSPLPGVRIRRSGFTAQSIANNSPVAIQFLSEDYDTDSFFDAVTSNSDIFIPLDGIYLLQAQVNWSSASGDRLFYFERSPSGSNSPVNFFFDQSVNGESKNQELSYLGSFNAGDRIRVRVFQSSGTSLLLNNSINSGQASFSAQWLSPS